MGFRAEWRRREGVAVETISDTEGASKYLSALSFLAILVEKFGLARFSSWDLFRGGLEHLIRNNMASMPAVISDAIALTEKKMDMTLDDIIKMSKKSTLKAKRQRIANKRQRVFANNFGERNNASKANTQLSVTSRSSAIREGKPAGRSRNGGSQFSAVKEAARRAVLMPVRPRLKWNRRRVGPQSVQRNGPYQVASNPKVNGAVMQRPHTLDSLFANMKEQRMRVQAQTGRRPRNYTAQRRKFYGLPRNFVGRQINYTGRQRSN